MSDDVGPASQRESPAFLRWHFQAILAAAYLAVGFAAGYLWAHRSRASLPPASCFDVSESKLRPPTHNLMADLDCAIEQCIVGTVANKCDRQFRAVFLDFNLFDGSDVQIGTADGLVQNLQPHGRARFTAGITGNPKIKTF